MASRVPSGAHSSPSSSKKPSCAVREAKRTMTGVRGSERLQRAGRAEVDRQVDRRRQAAGTGARTNAAGHQASAYSASERRVHGRWSSRSRIQPPVTASAAASVA